MEVETIVYTSGTTGHPKGARLTHDNILSVIRSLRALVPADDQDSYLSFLPLCHVFERIGGFFNGIHVGVTIYFAESLALLEDPRILSWVREKIREKNQVLACYEQIKDFRVVQTPFSPEGGGLTPTLKLRRKVILEKYHDLIESMYPAEV